MIQKHEISAIVRGVADVIRGYTASAIKESHATFIEEVKALEAEIPELRQQLAAMPVPVNGKDADPESVILAISQEVSRQFEALPKPKDGIDGAPGKDGKDANPISTLFDIREQVGIFFSELPSSIAGKDGMAGPIGPSGRDGKDADPIDKDALISEIVKMIPIPKDGIDGGTGPAGRDGVDGKAGDAGTPGRDGINGKDAEPIHPDTLALMVNTAVDQRVAAIPAAKDGAPGRDALQIDILPAIDLSKSYPRGIFARHSGGIVRSFRDTSPIPEGELIVAHGWEPVVDGLFLVKVEQSENLRSFDVLTMLTNGSFSKNTFTLPVQINRGVYVSGNEYERGDVVTLDGSQWHCEAERTKERPSASKDWLLVVKHGRNGKDAVTPSVTPTHPPVRLR